MTTLPLLLALALQASPPPAPHWCTRPGQVGCVTNATPPPPPPPAPRDITAALEASARAWSAGDLDGFIGLYAPDAYFVTSDAIIQGRDAIKARYLRRYGGKDGAAFGELTFYGLTARELGSADWAAVYGTYTLIHDPTQFPDRGVFDLIMHKTPEGWRIVSDHTS